jgi:hypothetical protein
MTKWRVILGCCAIALIATAETCIDIRISSPGGHDSCADGQAGGWPTSMNFVVTNPVCPFVIAFDGETVWYSGSVTAPSSVVNPSASYLLSNVYNSYDVSGIASDRSLFFQTGPSSYQADIMMGGNPGWGERDLSDPSHMQDSIVVEGASMVGLLDPTSWKALSGHVNGARPDLLGSTGVLTGVPNTWYLKSAEDSTGYSYKWIVDGSEVAGAVGATYSTSLAAGTHTIAGVAIRADNTRDSVVKSLEAYYPSISGPSSVQPFATCEWSVSISGGTSPFSYDWEAASGSGSSAFFDYENGSNDGESFTISLTVSDNLGFPITVSKIINVSNTARACAF